MCIEYLSIAYPPIPIACQNDTYCLGNPLPQSLTSLYVEKVACTRHSVHAQAGSLIYFGPPNLTDAK